MQTIADLHYLIKIINTYVVAKLKTSAYYKACRHFTMCPASWHCQLQLYFHLFPHFPMVNSFDSSINIVIYMSYI